MTARQFKAVFWDFGGVIVSSPFDAFNRYEAERGLPPDFIRAVNARNGGDNAWARLERSDVDIDGFCALFEAECRAAGHEVPGRDVLALLAGELRPAMVTALRKVGAAFKTACLTNNANVGGGPAMMRDPKRAAAVAQVMSLFDAVVESSKAGVRKPEPKFYQIACEMLSVQPAETVFLDDLGINLKPARAMGMHTIKVTSPEQAIADLEAALGIGLR